MNKQIYSIAFSIFILCLFSWTAWEAFSFHKLASYFPLYISLIAVLLSLINVVIQVIKYVSNKDKGSHKDKGSQKNQTQGIITLKYISWIVGYIIVIFLAGLIIGTVIFLFLFLLFETRQSLLKTIFSIVVTVSFLILIGNVLNLYWPTGLIGNIFSI